MKVQKPSERKPVFTFRVNEFNGKRIRALSKETDTTISDFLNMCVQVGLDYFQTQSKIFKKVKYG